MDKVMIGVLIILLFAIIAGGIWYIINPGAVRDLNRRFPEWDKYGKMCKASDSYIRLSGVVIIVIGVFMAIGLFILIKSL
ncbi:MAG: hypothetical protein K6E98_06065 [Lachnospiraceae bacterium]|nr:hypothetical protein [Lachnospiraceae bacterium]